MTYAVSILSVLLIFAVYGLVDQWVRRQQLIAFLALRKIPLPTDEEWEKCYRIVLRRIFRRRK